MQEGITLIWCVYIGNLISIQTTILNNYFEAEFGVSEQIGVTFLLNSQWVINKPVRMLGRMCYTWKKRKLLLNEVVCCAKCFIKSLLGICQFACSISWGSVLWTPLEIRSWGLSDLSYKLWGKKTNCHKNWQVRLRLSNFCSMLPRIVFL